MGKQHSIIEKEDSKIYVYSPVVCYSFCFQLEHDIQIRVVQCNIIIIITTGTGIHRQKIL